MNENYKSGTSNFYRFMASTINWRWKTSPFQKLISLLRDWSFVRDHQYGFDGGKLFLGGRLIEMEREQQFKTL